MTTSSAFCPHRLERLTRHLAAYVDDGRLPGVAARIVHRSRIVYDEALGWRDQINGQTLGSDDLYRIHSLSKPITSVAVLQLLEQGHFLLTDPLSAYLPEFSGVQVYAGGRGAELITRAPKQDLTIAHLLTHTAGFSYGMDDHPVDELFREIKPFRGARTIAEMTAKLARVPLKFEPGSQWEYSVAHDVLGRLVEVVSGLDFDSYLRQHLFIPLGMNDSGFVLNQDQQQRLITMYRPAEVGGIEIDDSVEDATAVEFFGGGGGLISSVPDCQRFMQMLLDKGTSGSLSCLSRKSVELMTMDHLGPALRRRDMWLPGHGYGLGVGVLVDLPAWAGLGSVGEFGWAGSGNTYFWAAPAEGLVALLFSQFDPSSQYTIAREFKTLMYQALR